MYYVEARLHTNCNIIIHIIFIYEKHEIFKRFFNNLIYDIEVKYPMHS